MKSIIKKFLVVTMVSLLVISNLSFVSAASLIAPKVTFKIEKKATNNNYKKFAVSGTAKQSANITVSATDKENTMLVKTMKTNKKGEFKLKLNLASLVDGKAKVKVVALNKKGISTKSQTITKKIVEKVVVVPPVKPEPPVVLLPKPPVTVQPEPPIVIPPITPEPPVIEPTPDPKPPVVIEPPITVPPIVEPTPEPESPVIVPPTNKTFPKGTGVSAYLQNNQKEINMIGDAGFNMVRADLYWSWIEEEKGVYNFKVNNYDTMIDGLLSKGITPYAVLAYSNLLYEKDGASIKTEEGKKAYNNYVDVVTKRYAGKGIVWEIWNEPNANWGDAYYKDYAELVKEAAKTIRKNDPAGHIVAPALAGTSPESFVYLENVFKEGILEYIDAVSVHPYRSWEPESAWYEYDVLRTLIKKYTDKELRIVNGEWGYSTTQGWWDLYLTDKQQAAYAVRMFLTDKMNDVDISIWYNWKDDSNDKNNSEHNFGLLETNTTPKDSYHATDAFHEITNGYEYKDRLDVKNDDDYLVKFKNKDNKTVYIAWTVGNAHKVNVPLTTVKGQVKDMFGKKQSDFNGAVSTSITLSETPVYIIAE